VARPPLSLDLPRWTGLWARLGARGNGRSTFDRLAAAYAEPARAYHNDHHLRGCLSEFDRNRTLARQADEVEAALWFHDAIYLPGSTDNEARSAHLAETALAAHGVPLESIRHVAALVLATRHLVPADDGDAQLVCDIDLSILGRAPPTFDEFERLIRREYEWVPEPIYRTSRATVLLGFLRRPSIYRCTPFVDRYELQARRNLERAVAALTA
jgi:predicted metal-dependent HD superfamily phosphohydrolase